MNPRSSGMARPFTIVMGALSLLLVAGCASAPSTTVSSRAMSESGTEQGQLTTDVLQTLPDDLNSTSAWPVEIEYSVVTKTQTSVDAPMGLSRWRFIGRSWSDWQLLDTTNGSCREFFEGNLSVYPPGAECKGEPAVTASQGQQIMGADRHIRGMAGLEDVEDVVAVPLDAEDRQFIDTLGRQVEEVAALRVEGTRRCEQFGLECTNDRDNADYSRTVLFDSRLQLPLAEREVLDGKVIHEMTVNSVKTE